VEREIKHLPRIRVDFHGYDERESLFNFGDLVEFFNTRLFLSVKIRVIRGVFDSQLFPQQLPC
jgi:hypothetical protein